MVFRILPAQPPLSMQPLLKFAEYSDKIDQVGCPLWVRQKLLLNRFFASKFDEKYQNEHLWSKFCLISIHGQPTPSYAVFEKNPSLWTFLERNFRAIKLGQSDKEKFWSPKWPLIFLQGATCKNKLVRLHRIWDVRTFFTFTAFSNERDDKIFS